MGQPQSLKNPVLYLRGLNTRGDDHLRFGYLAFGLAHQPWLQQLQNRNITAHAVMGRGGGPLHAQIQRAKEAILQMPIWQQSHTRFHLLAHSTGGLVARALVHELGRPQKILSVTTLATPHRGSWMAELLPSLPQRRPHLNRLLQVMDYRIDQKLPAFADLTAAQVSQFNLTYPDQPGVQYGSAVFSLKTEDLSWPLFMAQKMVAAGTETPVGDGLVAQSEQSWGHVYHQAALDHMNQIGYNFRIHPGARKKAKSEFLQLVDKTVDFMQRSEQQPLD